MILSNKAFFKESIGASDVGITSRSCIGGCGCHGVCASCGQCNCTCSCSCGCYCNCNCGCVDQKHNNDCNTINDIVENIYQN